MNRDIRLENVSKSYNGEVILSNFNLTIPSGTFFALLGPSGCGKTTLLRLIAGFESVDSGKIFLGDTDITNMPIHMRKINTVFQNYALFPHMNVFDNVAYSLKIKKIDKDIIEQKVIKILNTVHLEKHIYKSIQQLSGGQKQRVALARAIINEPDVLLLDEPLAALDLKLREKVLIELIDLQYQLKTTFVYVTHDQAEALTVADQMIIMNQGGQIEQIGTPKDIYEYPASSFVAKFVGTTNLLSGKLYFKDKNAFVHVKNLDDFSVIVDPSKEWAVEGTNIIMSIRPEKIKITKKDLEDFSTKLSGIVTSIMYHGRSTEYHILLNNDTKVQVFEQNEEHIPEEVIDVDDRVNLYWQKENVVLLEK